jgi:hypothetical protein
MYVYEFYSFLVRPKKDVFFNQGGLNYTMLTEVAEFIYIMLIVYFAKLRICCNSLLPLNELWLGLMYTQCGRC